MNSERELFEEYLETIWEGEDLIQRFGKKHTFRIINGDYVEDIVETYWGTWQASANRQGYKLVPVDDNTSIDYEYMEQNYKAK